MAPNPPPEHLGRRRTEAPPIFPDPFRNRILSGIGHHGHTQNNCYSYGFWGARKAAEILAELVLDPVMHTTGRVKVGNGGELAIGSKEMAPFIDTVRQHPDMLVADASRQRMELADRADALQLGLDAAATIQARNSTERMLAHQLAAAHLAAMEMQAEARALMRTYKCTGYEHHYLSIEAGRLMNASARMMDSYQRGLLTLERIRSGGRQTVVVQAGAPRRSGVWRQVSGRPG